MEVSKTMKDNPSQDRQLAAEPFQVWIYRDTREELMKLCEENGCAPGDVLRDAFDEWLSERRVITELFSESTAICEPDMTAVSSIDNLLERIRRDEW
jgi:hypothetical protein